MDDFCGSKFWDANLTWHTDNPDLTPCFEKTVLVWVPCAFLWLTSIMDIYYSRQSKSPRIPISLLNVAKTVCTIILIAFDICILVEAIQTKGDDEKIYAVDWSAAAIKIVTYIYYILLLVYSIMNGIQSSGVQFLFWFLLTLCQAFRFRTVVGDETLKSDNPLTFSVEVIYFPLCCFILFLNSWADDRPNIVNEKGKTSPDRQCPELYASFLSKLLFHWFTAMTWKGYRKPLEPADLWDLNNTDKSSELVPVFDVHWDKQREKCRRNKQISTKTNDDQQQSYANIVPAIFGAFWATLIFAWIIRVIPDVVLAFVSPQILDLLIDFSTSNDPVWKGILYAVILVLSAFLSTMLTAQSTHLLYATGMRIKISLISAIYRKALLLSSAARRESSTGQIVNLMSVDVQKIMEVISFLHYVWNVPLQIAVAIYFLWQHLGPSALAGLAVMVILLPLNAIIASRTRKLQIEQMKRKDNRVKLMNEILSGIKVLKLYAWEPSFESQIMKIRQEELSILRKAAYLDAFSIFLMGSSGFLVAIVSFATFILVDSNNVLDSKVAFVSMSLFNVISLGLNFLPMIVVMVVQAGVSAKRLNKFMNAEEIDPEAVNHDLTQNDPIVINRGTFSWERDNIALHNINLSIKPGSLVAVVGSVGSGKSTLLSAILGEIHKIEGTVNTSGSIAYVAQQAWIQNDTLKGNILFGRTYDRVKYDRVVEASALKTDFDILPAGDKTEIGEKGINLSGGQKQRVSLARATYSNAEIYLFDDPLSAVDSHVGKHIFEKVIGPKGLLKKKTRVLVTHGIQYLPNVDDIIVLKDGKISERGSYKDLLRTKGAFAEFLRTHLETADDEDMEELQDGAIIQDLEGVLGDISKIPRRGSSRRASETSQGSAQRRKVSRTISELDRRDSFAESEKSLGEEDVSKLIEKEKSETKSVKFSVYSDYFRAAGWMYMACTFVFYLANQSFSVGSNIFLSSWTNRLTNEDDNDDGDGVSKGAFLAIYGSLGIAQSLVLLVGACTMTLGTLKSASNLHWRMLQRILRSPLSFFDVTPAGRILNRFARDVDICDATLPQNFRYWLTYFFVVLSTIVVISYSTPIFVAVIVPIGVLYYFVQRFYVSTSRQLKRMESVTRSPIYSHFEETLTGATTIRAYSEQERFISDSEAKVDKNQMSYYPSIVSNRWLQVRLETVGNLVIFFAALFAVLSRDNVDAGVVGLSISYALQVTIALNMLVRWTSDVETNIVAVERLNEYAEVGQEAPWEIQELKPEASWPENGEVTFDHYQTRYRPGLDLVLRNVTCTIQPGEKVGIVGRTGAGKSSLTLALFRIVEAAGGSITIDGKDISRLGLHDVRGRITIIPQEPALFCGTLRMNLDPFEQQTDDTIWQALELAHLKSFARSLSGGLEHEISEGGENLSVGQRQLVCLARALLKKTKILVLDEATAAVDLETDDLIQETIRKEFKDSTVITIAHRLNTIMDSDKVMVLDKGEIREFDSPANLLKDKDTIFSGMARDAGIQ